MSAAARDTSMEHRRNELLTDVQAVAIASLTEHVSDAAAEMIASALVDRLADHWGGQLINFPKDHHWKLSKRDLEVYNAYNGHNLGELAQRYNISERGLRKLLVRVRERIAKASKSANHDLFND